MATIGLKLMIEVNFVEFIPSKMTKNTLYVSMKYKTAKHLCFCGSGSYVVTPLSPARWQISFDGETVSLFPSVGNLGQKCNSHYWIKRNKIIWDRKFSKGEIQLNRKRDKERVENYIGNSIRQKKDAEHSKRANLILQFIRKLFRNKK